MVRRALAALTAAVTAGSTAAAPPGAAAARTGHRPEHEPVPNPAGFVTKITSLCPWWPRSPRARGRKPVRRRSRGGHGRTR